MKNAIKWIKEHVRLHFKRMTKFDDELKMEDIEKITSHPIEKSEIGVKIKFKF